MLAIESFLINNVLVISAAACLTQKTSPLMYAGKSQDFANSNPRENMLSPNSRSDFAELNIQHGAFETFFTALSLIMSLNSHICVLSKRKDLLEHQGWKLPTFLGPFKELFCMKRNES